MLSRFYEVEKDSGSVLVDGVDIRGVKRQSLVSQMSTVLQDPFLFSGTVKENIKYNHTEASEEQMVVASKAVGAHDFILELEDGYDTFLSERGNNLSLGQRQLLSFARAIVADPKILILDEATANIDSHTEILIQNALRNLLEDRTALVIAHRLSTIRGADKIVVLQEGQIIEVGKHDELMEKEGGLTKGEREMIVVATSAHNQCIYCVVAHGAILRIREKNPQLADQIATNYLKADITPRQKAMLDFALKVSKYSHKLSNADIVEMQKQGFSNEDIWDIGAISALFALSNRMANLTSMRPNEEFYLLGRIPKENS